MDKDSNDNLEFYVTAAPGTEAALRDELIELRFRQVRLNRGGIPFFGTREDGWRACLESRIGQRVMQVIGRFPAHNLDELCQNADKIDWGHYLTAAQTISCAAFAHESCGQNPDFVALKTKDVIVDQMRRCYGVRPDVNRTDPDVRIFTYWGRDKATVYLDLSGEPLFKRGYRLSGGEAPLKETLASAILRMSGWDRKLPLVDPMCGSGTLLTEAGLWAANVAPGLRRAKFGFERWADFHREDAEALASLKGELRRRAHGQHPRITGYDLDAAALELAQANAKAAGLRLSFHQMPLRELQGDGIRRMLVTNPPYGVRLEAENSLYQELGNAIRRLKGWRAAVLIGNPRCLKAIRMTPDATFPLKNGAIDCQLAVFEI
jgi:putative N6-adenine-specific DNA methylase